ncbi:MAG: hypothetical protein VR78_00455 [Hoeflea sp. BRH_c9]|nr:MAG: hypothetical protein VR78_00455 [Hoeflea sp. BRH_c9]
MSRLWRVIKWTLLALVLGLAALLSPVAYVESFCRADPEAQDYQPLITDPDFQRAEANSYLTYPEWHIVYAYEGLAKTLETQDEHAFDYSSSIAGFWRSFCALNQQANRHGGGDFNTRATIHVIGASFTLELMMKAAYEETIGRLFALLRGSEKTPQDLYAAEMAADYATFLQQVPWYKYDFEAAKTRLWAEPVTSLARSWERRLALGGEFSAKSAYAGVIASAVEASGVAALRIRSVVSGLDAAALGSIEGVDVAGSTEGGLIIETPRYRKFTHILQAILAAGGTITEIAGNDEIMLSAVGWDDPDLKTLKRGEILSRIPRDGHDGGARWLIGVAVPELGPALDEIKAQGLTLEHIYDY